MYHSLVVHTARCAWRRMHDDEGRARAKHATSLVKRKECQNGVDATRFTCRYVVCRRRAGMAGKCYVEWPVASGSSNSPQGVERRCLWPVGGRKSRGGRAPRRRGEAKLQIAPRKAVRFGPGSFVPETLTVVEIRVPRGRKEGSALRPSHPPCIPFRLFCLEASASVQARHRSPVVGPCFDLCVLVYARLLATGHWPGSHWLEAVCAVTQGRQSTGKHKAVQGYQDMKDEVARRRMRGAEQDRALVFLLLCASAHAPVPSVCVARCPTWTGVWLDRQLRDARMQMRSLAAPACAGSLAVLSESIVRQAEMQRPGPAREHLSS